MGLSTVNAHYVMSLAVPARQRARALCLLFALGQPLEGSPGPSCLGRLFRQSRRGWARQQTRFQGNEELAGGDSLRDLVPGQSMERMHGMSLRCFGPSP